MRRSSILGFLLLVCASSAFADVALTDKGSALRVIARNAVDLSATPPTPIEKAVLRAANKAKRDAKHAKHGHSNGGSMSAVTTSASPVTPAQRAALRAANQAKRDAKHAKHTHSGRTSAQSFHAAPNATGSVALIDAGGLKYFINTNITFSTSSSASGAASEASYTAPIAASTTAGGTVMSSLSDMFDGYNGLCVSLTGATGPCATGNPSYTMYEKNGPAAVDATVPAVPECTNRQYVYPAQTIGGLSVRRKVYVPTNDRFIRWANIFTNTTGAPITFNMITSNNLGSDSNTVIVNSSSGDAAAQTTDLWVTTFQNFSGSTSTDPRIGHVLQGTGAPTPVSNINFANGDDNPFWAYNITLNPGQTKIILNYATGQGSKAAAATQAAAIAAFGTTARQCLSSTELSQVVNFAASADLSIVKTASANNVNGGAPFSYTLNVSNAGPATATSVSVTDTLPAGVSFVSVSGTGWTCGQAAGTVTCTMPSLAVGAANPITINVTAPLTTTTPSNTATVTSATSDPTPGNNSSTKSVTVTANADLALTKTTSTGIAFGGYPVTYTLSVVNNGPSPATSVSVSDTLPAGATFVSATGAGWTCGNVANVVTCTMPALAVGAAPPITLNMTAPAVTSAGTLTNTATVSSAATDPTPANNSGTVAIPSQPGTAIPTMSEWTLLLMVTILSMIGFVVLKRNS